MIIKDLVIDVSQPALIERYLLDYVVNRQGSIVDELLYLERVGKQEPGMQEIGRLLLLQGQCRLDQIKMVIWVPFETYQWFQAFDLHRIMFIETDLPSQDL